MPTSMPFNIISSHLKCFLDVVSGLGFEEPKARHGNSLLHNHRSLLLTKNILLTARVSDTDCDYPGPAPCSQQTGPGASSPRQHSHTRDTPGAGAGSWGGPFTEFCVTGGVLWPRSWNKCGVICKQTNCLGTDYASSQQQPRIQIVPSSVRACIRLSLTKHNVI